MSIRLTTLASLILITHIFHATPALAFQAPEQSTQSKIASPSSGLLEQINSSFADIFERVAPTVVIVKITRKPKAATNREMLRRFGFDFFLRERGIGEPPDGHENDERNGTPGKPDGGAQITPMPQSEGSGFIFSANGFILTNNHVIADADAICVRLKDGREFNAKIVGRDEKTDVAVLKIDAEGLPTVDFADSDTVRVGELVFVIGAPYNLDYSFTSGIISAIGRANLYQAEYESYIQTDASINPGNSGGPLLDIHGRVIGINTLINGVNRGLGFAIPINMAREVASQLLANGRVIRPWLGIRIQTLAEKPELRDSLDGIKQGVVVETIEPDTPAYRSNLLPADVITAIDNVPVETSQQLQQQVLSKKIGQTIKLKVWRSGRFQEIPVTTEELPDKSTDATPDPSAQEPHEEATAPQNERLYGLGVEDITPELAKSLDIPFAEGVLVREVETESPAEIAGILPQDIITEVGKQKTPNVAAFRLAMAEADIKRGILLFINRSGEKTYAMLKAE